MLKLIALLALTSSSAFAGIDFPPTNIPTASDWAIHMTEKACDMEASEDAKGTIVMSEEAVIYSIMENGVVVASATAKSSWVWAKVSCLNEKGWDFPLPPSDLPTASDWAISRTEKACGMEFSKDAKGTITKDENGVTYTVTDGSMVITSTANSSWIWSKVTCMNEKSFENPLPPTDLPTASDWAINRTEKACGVEFSKDAKGTITKDENGVTYTVTDGTLLNTVSATAKSTWIWAKVTCVK
jgi:hypothetical protein